MTRAGMVAAAVLLAASPASRAQDARTQGAGEPPLYYQDPDGKPSYSAGPATTLDGRPFRAVTVDVPEAASPPPGAASPTPEAARPAPAAGRRVLYYRNPMGLPDTSPTPKTDAMGMAYIAVYADAGARGDPPGTVRLSPGRIQLLGVRTAVAAMRPAGGRTIRATGIVQFDERRLATVTTRVPGWIEHLAVSAIGDPVRKGKPMAQIYAPDLVASEEEYLVAAGMGGEFAGAAMQRLRAQDVPEGEIARLRRTGRASRTVSVIAPEDGVVVDKPVQEGMRVAAGEALYRTADLSDVWIIAQVQEQELGALVPGAAAQASFVAFPGRVFEGKVDFIYPSLAAETRTARVRIVLPNRDRALRAEMYAELQLASPQGAMPVLAVPRSAVIDNGALQVVLVDRGEGRFEPKRVQLGARGDDWVEVRTGLRGGDRVATGANFLIDAESNLRAALAEFAAGAAP